jgi:hypothetical protein
MGQAVPARRRRYQRETVPSPGQFPDLRVAREHIWPGISGEFSGAGANFRTITEPR